MNSSLWIHKWIHGGNSFMSSWHEKYSESTCQNSCWWIYVRICCLDSWSWNLFMDLVLWRISRNPLNECTNELMAELVNLKSIQIQNYTCMNVAVFFAGKVVMTPFLQLAHCKPKGCCAAHAMWWRWHRCNSRRQQSQQDVEDISSRWWTSVVLILAWPACQQERKDRNTSIQVESLSKRSTFRTVLGHCKEVAIRSSEGFQAGQGR